MLQTIESVLVDQCGLTKDAWIVVGLSGGPDSLCLLDLLVRAGYRVHASHFNHGLRPEAEAEADEVVNLAGRLSVPCSVGRGDVRQFAAEKGLSVEAAGRQLRYRFLFSEARVRGAQAVAVGHTADDQVETVLMHFIRGSGLRGLGGMKPRTVLRTFDPSIPLVRPLLNVWHKETEEYCASHGFSPLRDSSNESLEYLRNRIRRDLIPALERYNPRFRETVLRNAAALSSDHQLLDDLLGTHWDKLLIRRAEDCITLDLHRLQDLSPALQRQIVRRAAELLAPETQMDFSDLDRAAEFVTDPLRRRTELSGGLSLSRESEVLYVAIAGARLPSGAWPQMPPGMDQLAITVPGHFMLDAGWQLEAEHFTPEAAVSGPDFRSTDRFRADIDASCLSDYLRLRIRRVGDQFQPFGMGGHSQKLADFFVNEKIPVRLRARWPLLCDGDTIVWVPGYRLAERFRLHPGSQQIARFWLKPPQ